MLESMQSSESFVVEGSEDILASAFAVGLSNRKWRSDARMLVQFGVSSELC